MHQINSRVIPDMRVFTVVVMVVDVRMGVQMVVIVRHISCSF
jgi:hypothetical protein